MQRATTCACGLGLSLQVSETGADNEQCKPLSNDLTGSSPGFLRQLDSYSQRRVSVWDDYHLVVRRVNRPAGVGSPVTQLHVALYGVID